MVTKSPTHKKDEQAVPCYYEEFRMLLSKESSKENVFVIIFNIKKKDRRWSTKKDMIVKISFDI